MLSLWTGLVSFSPRYDRDGPRKQSGGDEDPRNLDAVEALVHMGTGRSFLPVASQPAIGRLPRLASMAFFVVS